MKKILDVLTSEFENAFEKCGYDKKLGKVGISNRPDLCEYQCNGAMAGAKLYKKAPIMIANDVVEQLKDNKLFDLIEAVMPGFINIKLSADYIDEYVSNMNDDERLGYEKKEPITVIVDYGGANVAKPLHVGHLRPAIIGESVKRICRYAGDTVYGDVHLGDWGLPIGQVIEELRDRQPELPYFDENFTGEYPTEPPFSINELEDIYPTGSGKCKVDEEFKKRAQDTTAKLQQGNKAYMALWRHIMNVSKADLKKNYKNLNVEFDLIIILLKKTNESNEYFNKIASMKKLSDTRIEYNKNVLFISELQENCYGSVSEQTALLEKMMPHYFKHEITSAKSTAINNILQQNEQEKNERFQNYISTGGLILTLIFGLPSLYETLTIFRKLFSFYPYNIPYLTLENTSIILWLTLNGIIILKIYLRKYSPKIKKYCHLIVTRHRKSQESP